MRLFSLFTLFNVQALVLPIIFIPLLSFFCAIFSFFLDRIWLLKQLTGLMLLNIFLSLILFTNTVFEENLFFVDLGN